MKENNNEAISYMQQCRETGLSDEEIKNSLLNNGWSAETVSKLFLPKKDVARGMVLKFSITFPIILILGFLAYYFGPQAYLYYNFRNRYYNGGPSYNAVHAVLEKREINNHDSTNLIEINNDKFSFSSPWGESVSKNESDISARYKFTDNKSILIVYDSPGFLEHFNQNATSNEITALKNYFGEENMKDDLSFTKKLYSYSPDQLSIFQSHKDFTVTFVMLTLKSLLLVNDPETGLYYFNAQNARGFQMGNPEKTSTKSTFIDLYDNTGHKFELVIKNAMQNDVDIIINSFRFKNN